MYIVLHLYKKDTHRITVCHRIFVLIFLGPFYFNSKKHDTKSKQTVSILK